VSGHARAFGGVHASAPNQTHHREISARRTTLSPPRPTKAAQRLERVAFRTSPFLDFAEQRDNANSPIKHKGPRSQPLTTLAGASVAGDKYRALSDGRLCYKRLVIQLILAV
jgi:hypothetical protein